jgi:ABC-type phosphate transport system ATPase subunit
VFGTLSVEDNLGMGAYAARAKGAIDEAYDEAYDRVFDLFPILMERRRQFAGTLSGGQQLVKAIALGLAVVFSIMGLINFAHGELMTIAGYVLMGSLVVLILIARPNGLIPAAALEARKA